MKYDTSIYKGLTVPLPNEKHSRQVRTRANARNRTLAKMPCTAAQLTIPERSTLRDLEGEKLISYIDQSGIWVALNQPGPAAACPKCGGWSRSGGMSQYADSPAGCSCHR
jgi:hypothetical protein